MSRGDELYAGLDLGGTTLQLALAREGAEPLATRSIDTGAHDGPERVVSRMVELVRSASAEVGEPSALGVGCPGLVDRDLGLTRFLPNLPGQWRDVPLAHMLGEQLELPVYLLNDVRLATLGELTAGRGRDRSNLTMAFFAVGTGIGGGVVVDGKLRLGSLGAAGELGHMTIRADGPRCGCGNRGCVEAIASGPALVGEATRLLRGGQAPVLYELVEGDLSRVSPRAMAEAAGKGDQKVAEAIERAGEALGIAVSNIVVALHPELVVLGGGVAKMGDRLLDSVKSTVNQTVCVFPPDDVSIELSSLGDGAGALGGVALAARGGNPVG